MSGQIIGLLKASAVENKTELYHTIRTLSQILIRPFDELATSNNCINEKEERYARNNFDYPCNFDAVWCNARLAT